MGFVENIQAIKTKNVSLLKIHGDFFEGKIFTDVFTALTVYHLNFMVCPKSTRTDTRYDPSYHSYHLQLTTYPNMSLRF